MVNQGHHDYVLAIPQASSYYDMRLVTFGIDEDDKLVVCFPIFVKDFSSACPNSGQESGSR